MKAIKILASIVIVAVAAFFTWNYFAGPLKYKRDMHAFADSVEQCASFSQPVLMFGAGVSLVHAVDGPRDGKCIVRMETHGPAEIECAFAMQDLATIAKGFGDLADSVDMFGGYTFHYDSNNPDPLTRALNSDSCTTRSG